MKLSELLEQNPDFDLEVDSIEDGEMVSDIVVILRIVDFTRSANSGTLGVHASSRVDPVIQSGMLHNALEITSGGWDRRDG